jgi:hypothetical protein
LGKDFYVNLNYLFLGEGRMFTRPGRRKQHKKKQQKKQQQKKRKRYKT